MWETIIWTIFGVLVGLGGVFMSLNPPEYFISRLCFFSAMLIFVARLGWWLAFEYSPGKKNLPIILAIIIFGFIGGVWLFSTKWLLKQENKYKTISKLENKIPQLQITPIDVEENFYTTTIKLEVLNDSDCVAKNIYLDVKFGDSQWKHQVWKASSLNSHNKLLENKNDLLMATILSQTNKEKLKEIEKKYLNHPTCEEVKPHKSVFIYIQDINKDWALKQKLFFKSGDKITPINPEENPDYLGSQGWKEQIEKIKSGEFIVLWVQKNWEDEVGKKIGEQVEYQLIVTKVGTGRSYKFLPTGKLIKLFF